MASAAPLSDLSGPAPFARLDLVLLRQDRGMGAWRYIGQSQRLVLCFSGVGTFEDEVLQPEMVRSATDNGRDSALFITDPARSWLNRPGLIAEIADLARKEAEACGAAEICTLGHSMGGFMALVMPAFVPVHRALALSPQISVHPELAGQDPRWMMYRSRIASHALRSATDHLVPETRYSVIFGRDPREAPQRDLVAPRANLDKFVLRRVSHNSAGRLKEAGILDQSVAAAFANDAPALLAILQSAFDASHFQHVGETE